MIHGDCLEILDRFKEDMFDLTFFDPPFNQGKTYDFTTQNIIIWKKMTSAVPQFYRYMKSYQVIVFATKGEKPNTFNKLRIDKALEPHQKKERSNGVMLTDIWDDIRELTSGYYAGTEPIRDHKGNRICNQQSPIQLLLRIILASSKPGDKVLDPCAGTGTTQVVGMQLRRETHCIELDKQLVTMANHRLNLSRFADHIGQYREYYRFTENLDEIWG